MPAMAEDPTIQYTRTHDGMDIAYTVTGQGFPLVRLPVPAGGIENRSLPPVAEQAAAFEERFLLVEYDGRGQGHSTREITSSTRDDLVTDLDAVVAAARVERFVLSTMWDRCPAAVSYAAERPERVAALILWDPFPMEGESPRQANLLAVLQDDALVKREARFWEQARRQEFGQARQGRNFGAHAEYPSRENRIIYTRDRMTDARPWLPAVQAPILLLQGSDAHHTEEERVCVAAQLSAARRVRTPGLEPAPRGQNLRPALAAIDDFIRDFVPEASHSPHAGNGHLGPVASLTAREREILALVAAGHSNREVGETLSVSEATVARHVSNLFAKLGVHNRVQAAAFVKAERSVFIA